ncbi:MAG: PASTA domain-containing protein [Candidatus Eremiobacteraeota bacterium]|nr:PASTA domain-containing protein [Candidatus Eremiobacteraeota bacterium]
MQDNIVSYAKTLIISAITVFTLAFAGFLGWTVYQSFFKIPDEITVPNIEGKNVTEANTLLRKFNLILKIDEEQYKENIPRDQIIRQNPPPGRSVRKGREVKAIVSMGPEMISVPDLTAMSLREATIELTNKRLLLGKVKTSKEKKDEPEQVLDQNPAPGEKVRKGASVQITINKGVASRISTPNWEGKQLDQVREAVTKSELVMGRVRWVYHDYIPKGEIIRQTPQPGQLTGAETPVSFDVSAGQKVSEVSIKQEKVTYVTPETGNQRVEVKFVLKDQRGLNEYYTADHLSGDKIEVLVTTWGEAELMIYVDGKLQKKEIL